MEKHNILGSINDTANQMESYMAPLDEDKLNTVPYQNSWTAAQLLRHLVKSTELMTDGLQTPGKPADRDPGARIPELRQVFEDRTNRLQSPDVIVPETRHYQKDESIAEWHDAFQSFNIAADAADPAILVEDLPLGPVTKWEIINFVQIHLQRHLIQMQKIIAAL